MAENILSIEQKSKNTYMVKDQLLNEVYEDSYIKCLEYIRDKSVIDKPTFYVIKDLMTWATNSVDKSKIERFETLDAAILEFNKYRSENYNKEFVISNEGLEYARLTLGAQIGFYEIDVVHVRNDQNFLVQDFKEIKAFNSNYYFIEAVNRIKKEIGLDFINIYHKPSEQEIDTELYRIGKVKGLSDDEIQIAIERNAIPSNWIPKLIKEKVPINEWENCYLEMEKMEPKLFIDGSLKLVEKLNPGDTVTLSSGRTVIIEKTQLFKKDASVVGIDSESRGKEVTFSYQEIKKILKDMQEIRPKTLSEKILDTKKTITMAEKYLKQLESAPQRKDAAKDIEHEKKIIQRLKTNLAIFEEYKNNPEKMSSQALEHNEILIEKMEHRGYVYDKLSSTSSLIVFRGPSGTAIFESWDKLKFWNDNIDKRGPSAKDMEYVKTLAEKMYASEKGSLDNGFESYFEDVKKEVKKDGYGAVIGRIKDELNNNEREGERINDVKFERGLE